MKWFYTEGRLTVSSEQQERNFLLNDLVLETAQRTALIKRVKAVFFSVLAVLCFLQFAVSSFPMNQSAYFYIGYIGTPIIISSLISFLVFIILKNKRLELKALSKLFKTS
ncbi:hypothetical protein OAJ35_04330 [Gammaproteobacteria bacterium]|nr:hypothetical protein [Gammaproteobacteria bacterium]